MPALKYSKKGKKTYVYIIENRTEVDSETNKKKKVRVTLESLGILNKEVSKSQAKIALSRYMDRKQPLTSDMTLKLLVEEFKVYYKNQIGKTIKEGTYGVFIYDSNRFKSIEHLKIRELKFTDIENLKESLTYLSNRSINMTLVELRKVLKYAKKRNYISEIPTIENLKENSKEIIRLNKDQLHELINTSEGDIKFYIYVMSFTGMRPNEFLNLKWEDVDLDRGFITIKSDNKLKSGRKIAIHQNLLEILKDRDVLSIKVCPYISRHSARSAVSNAGKKIGLKISPYSLRKTFASLMAENEVSPFKLAKMMGHSNIGTTYKYYVEFEEEKLKEELQNHPMADKCFLKEDEKRTKKT